jgi:hypothetical protein
MRSARSILLFSMLWGACTPDVPHSALAVAPAPAPELLGEEAVAQGAARLPEPPVQAMSAPPWRWVYHGPEAIRRGAHERRVIGLGPDEVRLDISVNPERMVLSRRRVADAQVRWEHVISPAPFVGMGELMRMETERGPLIVAALYSRIATGCRLVGLDEETGAVRWSVQLKGLGDVSHGRYRNDVRLDVVRGQIVAYGAEASGRYVEVVDPMTGRTQLNARVEPELEEWTRWGHERDSARAEALRQALVSPPQVKLVPLPNTWTLVPELGAGELRLDAPLERLRGLLPTAAAMVGERVGVLYHDALASGGVVVGIDRAGQRSWETPLVALGPSDHVADGDVATLSAWRGRLVVSGRSAAGRYVEILDAKTGQPVWHERWFD